MIASSDSVTRAYEKFVEARREYTQNVARAGLTFGSRPVANVQAAERPLLRQFALELGLFVVKTCIVFAIIGELAVVAGSRVTQAAEQLVRSVSPQVEWMGKISLSDVAIRLGDVARDAQNMPPERKEILRQSIGILSREAEPWIDAWRNPPPSDARTVPSAPGPRDKPER